MNPSFDFMNPPSHSPQVKPRINNLPAELMNEILFHLKDNFDEQVNLIEGIFTDQATKDVWHLSLLQQFYPEAYKEWELIKDGLPALREKHGDRLLPLSALARYSQKRKVIDMEKLYAPIEICQLNSLPSYYRTHEGWLHAAARVGNTELCLWLLEDQGLATSIEAVCRTATAFDSTETVLTVLEWIKKNNDELHYKSIASEILDLAIYNRNEKLIEILMHDRDIMPTLHGLAILFIHAREYRLSLWLDEEIFFQIIFAKLFTIRRKELVEKITTISDPYINIKGEIAYLEELKEFIGFEEIIDSYIQEKGITREKIVQSQKNLLYRAIQEGNLKRVVDLYEKQSVPLSIGELIEWISHADASSFSTSNITINYFLKQKANTITAGECDQLLNIRYENELKVYLDCLQAKQQEEITDWVGFIKDAVSHEEDSMDIIHAYRIKRLVQQSSHEKLYDEAMKIAIKEDKFEIVRRLLKENSISPRWNEYVVMKQAIKEVRFKIVMGLIEISGDKFKKSFPWEKVLCKSIPEDPYKFNKLSMIVCELLNRKVFLPTEELLVQYAEQIVKRPTPSIIINGIQLVLILLNKFKMPHDKIPYDYSDRIANCIWQHKDFQLLEQLALHKKYPQIMFRQDSQKEKAWIEGILEWGSTNGVYRKRNKPACLKSLCNLIVHYGINEETILKHALFNFAEARRLDLVIKLVDYKKQNKLLTHEDKDYVDNHCTFGKSGKAWFAEVFPDAKPKRGISHKLKDFAHKTTLQFRR